MPKLLLNPEFNITFLIFLGSLAVVGLMVWVEKRPRESFTPNLLPTTPLMLVAGFIGLLALVHLMNLAGVVTGR